ncbi:hypothetical protein EC973_000543 [Apophysomyces ossiformis]|uniref:Uncharacterized protein n=1 Tax=Apophysomyces ossiformis TaxID=679940 RepID=A0A8H7BR70_9FUNG|nr:hypothetical protein EC973_000543 [Apophysomyces ossiformis]
MAAQNGHPKHTAETNGTAVTEKEVELETEQQLVDLVELQVQPEPNQQREEKKKEEIREQQRSASKPRFVTRVSSIPIVQDGVSTVQAYASKTYLGRFALTTANSTLTTVSKYTSNQPKYVQNYYENYVQPHLERADQFGCRSLDLLQNRFPVVSQPTSEIVSAVTTPSYQIIDGVRVKLDTTVRQPAQSAAKAANQRLTYVVDNVEAVLDRYLPNQQQQTKSREVSSEKNNGLANGNGNSNEDNNDTNQAIRAYHLLNEATLRLSQRVQNVQLPRSRDDLARLADASAVLQTTTANIQLLQETLRTSVTVYAQTAQERYLPPAVTARLRQLHTATSDRLQVLTQQVSVQLNQAVGYLKSQSSETPDWIKERVQSLVDVANKQIELVKTEYARSDISSYDKAKNVAQGLQNQVLPILQNVQSQLQHYTEAARQKAQNDLKLPFEYLGLAHSNKVATTAQ